MITIEQNYAIPKEDHKKVKERINTRINKINAKYGVHLETPCFDLDTIDAISFFEYCGCDLLEDPEYILYGQGNATALPDTMAEFTKHAANVRNEISMFGTQSHIGTRLRNNREKCRYTVSKVVKAWNRISIDTNEGRRITQATITNHDNGKLKPFPLWMLLRYCSIYSGNIFTKSAGPTPSEIIMGCTYDDIMKYYW